MSAVSDQYAVALFELTLECDCVETVDEAFSAFKDALNPENTAFFLHPKITKADKKSLVLSMNYPGVFNDFLYVIIDNNRFTMLSDIYQGFKKVVENRDKLMRIQVYSGKKLSQERLETLTQQYEQKYRRQVLIDNIIETSIVGGLRFEYNGLVIDDTVNHTLNQLKSRLTK